MDKYDWITTVFSDWAFTFVTSFLYYQDQFQERSVPVPHTP